MDAKRRPVERTLERTPDTRAQLTIRRSSGRSFAARAARCSCPMLAALLVAALSVLVAPAARAVGVTAALLPDTSRIAAGTEFTVTLSVPVAGHPFNAYDAAVSWDPAALTFLPTSPTTLQEGAAMVAACPSRFHSFASAGDSLAVSHVLLCAGTAIASGELYRLRFRAGEGNAWTTIRLRSIRFYDAGLFVALDGASDAAVWVGTQTGVGPEPPPATVRVRIAPNPCRSASEIVLESPAAGARVRICDVQGRVVRRFEDPMPAGTMRLAWDLKDGRGLRVAPGIYRVLVEGAGAPAGARMVVLP